MAFFRKARGFERAGNLKPADMSMPVARARTLTLLRAWKLIAGESLAQQVRAVEIKRGVLELEAADPAWRAAVEPLLAALTGRLAGEYPKLRAVKYRLGLKGQARPSSTIAIELPAVVDHSPGNKRRPLPARTVKTGNEPPVDEHRLRRLSDRYLERCAEAERSGHSRENGT